MREREIKNTVIVIADTLRRDHLGLYGNPWIRTPHLDAFGARSVVFDRAIVGSFACMPNRQDCWTGCYSYLDGPWRSLSDADIEFPIYLEQAGRRSMLISDQVHMFIQSAPRPGHAARSGSAYNGNYHRAFTGWEHIRGQAHDPWRTDSIEDVPLPCDPAKIKFMDSFRQHQRNTRQRQREEDYFAPQVFRAAADWAERNHTEDGFCLVVDCFDPHEPWDPPRYYAELYDPGYRGEEVGYPPYGPADIMSPAELRHMRALYAGEVTMVDRWLGFFLEKLDYLGLLDNTLVAITSDHGHMLGEHGRVGKDPDTLFYPEVARVPLIVWDPRLDGQGRRDNALAQTIDLCPTILDAMGAQAPAGIHGRSLLPRLADPAAPWRAHAIFGQHGQSAHVYDGEWQFGVPLSWRAGARPVLLNYERPALAEDPATAEMARARLGQALREQLADLRAPEMLRSQVDAALAATREGA